MRAKVRSSLSRELMISSFHRSKSDTADKFSVSSIGALPIVGLLHVKSNQGSTNVLDCIMSDISSCSCMCLFSPSFFPLFLKFIQGLPRSLYLYTGFTRLSTSHRLFRNIISRMKHIHIFPFVKFFDQLNFRNGNITSRNSCLLWSIYSAWFFVLP